MEQRKQRTRTIRTRTLNCCFPLSHTGILNPIIPSVSTMQRWRFMLGTIRTIQHQAERSLPICALSNQNLMNTLRAVGSSLFQITCICSRSYRKLKYCARSAC
ncbi:uncharacterized protein LOC144207107 isoform X1 [Stigmatopora nigra]